MAQSLLSSLAVAQEAIHAHNFVTHPIDPQCSILHWCDMANMVNPLGGRASIGIHFAVRSAFARLSPIRE